MTVEVSQKVKILENLLTCWIKEDALTIDEVFRVLGNVFTNGSEMFVNLGYHFTESDIQKINQGIELFRQAFSDTSETDE